MITRAAFILLLMISALMLLSGCSDESSSTSNNGRSDIAKDANTEDSSTGDTNTGDIIEDTESADTSNSDTESADTSTSDTESTDTSNSDTESTDTSTDSGPGDTGDTSDTCESGLLCGQPVECCALGDECIDSTCLAICDSGVRCGADRNTCCAGGELCVANECVSPGDACLDSYDCVQPGEFCEPTLGQCLPQPEEVSCTVIPEFDSITEFIEWSFEEAEIISIPIVADLDGDNYPEVIVNLSRMDGGGWPSGEVVVLNGQNGEVIWRNGPNTSQLPHTHKYGAHGRSTLAVGDVSGDGLPDILYAGRPTNNLNNCTDAVSIYAMNGQGEHLWESHDAAGQPVRLNLCNAAISVANFDDDPEAELVIGATLIDHDGLVVWNQDGDGASFGSNNGYRGGISAIVNLDDDPTPEIVSGRNAWDVTWDIVTPSNTVVLPLWTYGEPIDDGYPAIADLDGNNTPEVVLVSNGRLHLLNGATGALWCGVDPSDAACIADPSKRTPPIDIPMPSTGNLNNNRGGPPTVADFDADGFPEIGIAGGYAYTVYDIRRAGDDPVGDVPLGGLHVRWSQDTQDLSSNATGSSVFDFQGDGAAEVIYADECHMRIYSGVDGSIQLEIPNTSATIHEYPLVVDVDNDGNSEILIVSTNVGSCGDLPQRKGLFVYGDPNDQWVPSRRVWTQHTYHVTNATSTGNAPMTETDSWVEGVNSYRQNAQGEGVFNAPDLSLDLSVNTRLCGDDQLELIATVSNIGALGILPGVQVQFYQGSDAATGLLLGTAETQISLLPGGSTQVFYVVDSVGSSINDFFAIVNAEPEVEGAVVECDADNNGNNSSRATNVSCPIF